MKLTKFQAFLLHRIAIGESPYVPGYSSKSATTRILKLLENQGMFTSSEIGFRTLTLAGKQALTHFQQQGRK